MANKAQPLSYYDGRLDGIQEERARIIQALNELEEHSHRTRTPIYQEKFFLYLRNVLNPHITPTAYEGDL